MQFLNFLLPLPVVLLQLAGVAHAAPRGSNTTILPGAVVHKSNGFEWLSLPSSADLSHPALNLSSLLELSAAGRPLPSLPSGIPAPSRLSDLIGVHADAATTIHCETSDASPYRMYSEKMLKTMKQLQHQWCCVDKPKDGTCRMMLMSGYPKPGAAATDICNYTPHNHICLNCGAAAWAIEVIIDKCTEGVALNRQAGGYVKFNDVVVNLYTKWA
ncbi:hypothetical protein BZA05DRAFT_448559 [Tricharina praecox]|uniref:uncharacterized protein n=1 Tax=Tricharina praecox TaxID=43433 RepID=UPI00221E980B|nr:uncharacterized protein BZA05DRAFT_448559 [Tricharina praecox]KAI5844206.1 hypothetical protein BZA05DRAFT_448559 [Tricharina praecox]